MIKKLFQELLICRRNIFLTRVGKLVEQSRVENWFTLSQMHAIYASFIRVQKTQLHA
jgi:hypothetical protein